MTKLEQFMSLLTGSFDNSKQYEQMQKEQKESPFARHINHVCNGKILHLPEHFQGIFMVEESYYTTGGHTHGSHHLFLFTEEKDGILLTSYEIPDGYDKNTFTYENLAPVEFSSLKPSAKFTPALYTETDGIWEGGSISMFTPVLKFTLHERFSEACLEVTETMEMNGKRTFGFDEPIRYVRCM